MVVLGSGEEEPGGGEGLQQVQQLIGSYHGQALEVGGHCRGGASSLLSPPAIPAHPWPAGHDAPTAKPSLPLACKIPHKARKTKPSEAEAPQAMLCRAPGGRVGPIPAPSSLCHVDSLTVYGATHMRPLAPHPHF